MEFMNKHNFPHGRFGNGIGGTFDRKKEAKGKKRMKGTLDYGRGVRGKEQGLALKNG